MTSRPDLIAGKSPSATMLKGFSASIPQFRHLLPALRQFKNLPPWPGYSSVNAATACRSWAFGGSNGD